MGPWMSPGLVRRAPVQSCMGRLRRCSGCAARWGLSVAAALLLGALVISGWEWVGFQSTGPVTSPDYFVFGPGPMSNTAAIGCGMLVVELELSPLYWGNALFVHDRVPAWSGWAWWPRFQWANRRYMMPLWIPLVLTALPAGLLWRVEIGARRRGRAGKCTSCGYDRGGLGAGALCPECGASAG